mmetsp:Transcript_45076/g.123641  ORF Transcript_45076/g.123641 Transcript_45076/m.123641 type:complete len:238 (+) Transcript_45076:175-888(+)
MQTNVAYWRLWILLSFIAGGLVVYDFNSSTCATCESSGKRDEQPQTTLRGVVDRQPQTLTLRARPEVGLPTSADYIIERESHSSIQPCNPEQTSPAGRAEKFGPILLSQGVMRFGTSARRQEVDAVDMINKMQFQRSVCGPLAEIGVYKGWFVAALTSIAVIQVDSALHTPLRKILYNADVAAQLTKHLTLQTNHKLRQILTRRYMRMICMRTRPRMLTTPLAPKSTSRLSSTSGMW